MTAPKTAENVCRGTPNQSAHVPYSRVSLTITSPTSNTTARITFATIPPPAETKMGGGCSANDPAVGWLAGLEADLLASPVQGHDGDPCVGSGREQLGD